MAPNASPAYLLTWLLDFCDLNLSMTIDFVLVGLSPELIQKAWSNELFPKNLPLFQANLVKRRARADLLIHMESRQHGRLIVRVTSRGQTVTYQTNESELPEDLLKLVLQRLAGKAALHRLVIFHASALVTERGAVLIPGPSGTGKSTVALWWMASGLTVAASETAVVRDNVLHGGNILLSVKQATAERYLRTMHLPEPEYQSGEYLLFRPATCSLLPVPIEAIAFVKLTEPDSPVIELSISARRASMKLYDNAHWIATGGFLLGGQCLPAPPLFEYSTLTTIATTVSRLSAGEIRWIEGGPMAIGNWLEDRF